MTIVVKDGFVADV